jgi:NADPH-dependent glutamate synthase beta subunit-like oxidoreductase
MQDPREYLIQTKRFTGDENGNVTGVETVRIDWQKNDKGAVSLYKHTFTHTYTHVVQHNTQPCGHVASSGGNPFDAHMVLTALPKFNYVLTIFYIKHIQFIPVEVAGSEQTFECDLAFLAMGFLGPEETLIEQFKLAADPRGNIKADFGKHYTSVDKVILTANSLI